MGVSEPQNRTLATRMARPRLAPQAEKVMKMNIRNGLAERDNQKNENNEIRDESVAASRINRRDSIEGWGKKKSVVVSSVRERIKINRGRNIY